MRTLSDVRGLKRLSMILDMPVVLPDGTVIGYIRKIEASKSERRAKKVYVETLGGRTLAFKPGDLAIDKGFVVLMTYRARRTCPKESSGGTSPLAGVLKHLAKTVARTRREARAEIRRGDPQQNTRRVSNLSLRDLEETYYIEYPLDKFIELFFVRTDQP